MPSDLTIIVSGQQRLSEIAEQYRFTQRQIQQIGTSAINRSLGSVQSHVVKRLASEINLRQREIRENVGIQKASYDRMQGSVSILRSLIPLFDFIGAHQTDDGVEVQVRKDGPSEVLKGTFIADVETGHAGIQHTGIFERATHLPTKGPNVATATFARNPKGFPYRTVSRFAIFERFGLTLTAYLVHAPDVVEEEQAAAGEILMKNLNQQVQRRLASINYVPSNN